ncbi:hypothetical protein Tco_1076524 [Tanacetum coccineum]
MGDENPIRTYGELRRPIATGLIGIPSRFPEWKQRVPLRRHPSVGAKPDAHSTDTIPCSILSTGNDCKTPQQYPDVPTTSWRISILSMNSFQGLTPKSPSSWHRSLAQKDLALYDNESWNDPRDFAKPVKAIALPQDVPSTSDRRLFELENQVQRLMEANLAPTQLAQVNKITTPCEVCSGPHDTQNCMKNPEQAFVEYASSRIDEAGGDPSSFVCSFLPNNRPLHCQHKSMAQSTQSQSTPSNPKNLVVNEPDIEQEEGNLKNTNSNPQPQPNQFASIATEQVQKLNSMLQSLGLVPQSPNTKFVYTKEGDGEVMFIEIIRDDDEPRN